MHLVNQFGSNPYKLHLFIVYRSIGYIQSNADLGIIFLSTPSDQCGFSDLICAGF